MIAYQIIYNKEDNFNPTIEIAISLKDLLDNYLASEFKYEDVFDFIVPVFYKVINDKEIVFNFYLNIPSEVFPIKGSDDGVLKAFNDLLKNHEKIKFVSKYYDDNLLSKLSDCYQEIFKIEMDLRWIISYIFIDTYGSDFYNLLREFDTPLQFRPKNKNKLREELEKRFIDNFENEFFYLLFPDYRKFTELKPIKLEDVLYILSNSKDFADLRNGVGGRGIKLQKYIDFLNSIKEDLESIEIMRNCVAHNRTPTQDEVASYEISKSNITSKIGSFW